MMESYESYALNLEFSLERFTYELGFLSTYISDWNQGTKEDRHRDPSTSIVPERKKTIRMKGIGGQEILHTLWFASLTLWFYLLSVSSIYHLTCFVIQKGGCSKYLQVNNDKLIVGWILREVPFDSGRMSA